MLRLLIAVIDGDDARAHEAIDATDSAALSHLLARKLIISMVGDRDLFDEAAGDDEELPGPDAAELRDELRRDLLAALALEEGRP